MVRQREVQKYPATVSQVDLAKFLNVTERWVRQMVEDGILIKDDKGKLPFRENVLRYYAKKIDEVTAKAEPSKGDKLRERREEQLQMRMDTEQRKLVPLDEALTAFSDISGAFLETLSGLPARITRNPDERRRIEVICDAERKRLSTRFGKHRETLRTGEDDPGAVAETDT